MRKWRERRNEERGGMRKWRERRKEERGRMRKWREEKGRQGIEKDILEDNVMSKKNPPKMGVKKAR